VERVERLFYRILASLLLPRRLWCRTGRDLLHTFDAVMEEAGRGGNRNVTRVYLGELGELIRGAFQLRFGVHRAQRAPQHQFDIRTTTTWSNIMEGWIREMRLAVRSMVKRPGFAALAIVIAVTWARMTTKNHTLTQAVLGVITGVAPVLLAVALVGVR